MPGKKNTKKKGNQNKGRQKKRNQKGNNKKTETQESNPILKPPLLLKKLKGQTDPDIILMEYDRHLAFLNITKKALPLSTYTTYLKGFHTLFLRCHEYYVNGSVLFTLFEALVVRTCKFYETRTKTVFERQSAYEGLCLLNDIYVTYAVVIFHNGMPSDETRRQQCNTGFDNTIQHSTSLAKLALLSFSSDDNERLRVVADVSRLNLLEAERWDDKRNHKLVMARVLQMAEECTSEEVYHVLVEQVETGIV